MTADEDFIKHFLKETKRYKMLPRRMEKGLITEPERKHLKIGDKCKCGGKMLFVFYSWHCVNKINEKLELEGYEIRIMNGGD